MRSRTLGIIAGRGTLPAVAARCAAAMGRRVIVCLLKEAGGKWPSRVGDRVETISIGQAGRVREYFLQENVGEVLMIGKVDKQLNFAQIEFDDTALAMLARLAGRADMNLAHLVIDEFSTTFHVAKQTDYLKEHLAAEGVIAGSFDDEIRSDAEFGMRAAKGLARYDVGQTVAVRSGAVIAVEAFEHTDETIKRAGRLSGGGFVLVKAARPKQDFRFDVPTVGPTTVVRLAKAGGRALAVEAGKTLMLERGRMIRLAEKHGICVVGMR